MERRPGFAGPLLIIAFGLVLLFNKLGFFQGVSWAVIWHYWPVILIIWGIEIIARNTGSSIIYFLAVFLSIALMIGTILLAWMGYPLSDNDWKYGTGIHFEGEDFNFADLDNADFNNSNLNGANMNFASMQNANFSYSSLEGANMNFADMNYARLDNADMNGANLNFASLKYADLRNADLEGSNLNFVDLDGANMAGAHINGASHVFAGTSTSTICPDSSNGPCW